MENISPCGIKKREKFQIDLYENCVEDIGGNFMVSGNFGGDLENLEEEEKFLKFFLTFLLPLAES